MNTINLTIDILLGIAILLTAVLCLRANDLFKAVLLFMSMGMFVTLAWARLNAWDVAIAEAAIGAALTGALFIAAIKQLNK